MIAPELQLAPAYCPWLTRVAGTPIERPEWWTLYQAKLARAMQQIAGAFGGFATAVGPAVEAFRKLGEAFEQAKIRERIQNYVRNGAW